MIRGEIIKLYLDLVNKEIGGEGQVIEIGECCLAKRKYNRRRKRNNIWVFGAIDLNYKSLVLLKCVGNRTQKTLLNIISNKIQSTSIIINDGWKAFHFYQKKQF